MMNKKFNILAGWYLVAQLLLDTFCQKIAVSAQSFPVFSQSSYSFTVTTCGAGTYVGQVWASGATSYSTDNSFVISIDPSSGALSLSATIASTTTFNVIARNQYGSTQAPVTVYANCGGGNTGTGFIPNTVYTSDVNYATYTNPVYNNNPVQYVSNGIPTTVIDYNTPVAYSSNNVFPYSSYYNGYIGWDGVYKSGNTCYGNWCPYGGAWGRGNRYNNAYGHWSL
ncbi:uncharacterized protein LOC129599900 [Paramacrobiotus metropolitanus]|uniref:uncharacterized protein LOC129599900 n=1 Tax=Paramacrobiotus metropolitanus TaxID=2943436 RepID=UPI0024463134|nr:uncharacterized protein LOC129599900 [Paramacrobiotus metropolitanus]